MPSPVRPQSATVRAKTNGSLTSARPSSARVSTSALTTSAYNGKVRRSQGNGAWTLDAETLQEQIMDLKRKLTKMEEERTQLKAANLRLELEISKSLRDQEMSANGHSSAGAQKANLVLSLRRKVRTLQKSVDEKNDEIARIKGDARVARIQELVTENTVIMGQLRRLQYLNEEFAKEKAAEGGVSAVELQSKISIQADAIDQMKSTIKEQHGENQSLQGRIQELEGSKQRDVSNNNKARQEAVSNALKEQSRLLKKQYGDVEETLKSSLLEIKRREENERSTKEKALSELKQAKSQIKELQQKLQEQASQPTQTKPSFGAPPTTERDASDDFPAPPSGPSQGVRSVGKAVPETKPADTSTKAASPPLPEPSPRTVQEYSLKRLEIQFADENSNGEIQQLSMAYGEAWFMVLDRLKKLNAQATGFTHFADGSDREVRNALTAKAFYEWYNIKFSEGEGDAKSGVIIIQGKFIVPAMASPPARSSPRVPTLDVKRSESTADGPANKEQGGKLESMLTNQLNKPDENDAVSTSRTVGSIASSVPSTSRTVTSAAESARALTSPAVPTVSASTSDNRPGTARSASSAQEVTSPVTEAAPASTSDGGNQSSREHDRAKGDVADKPEDHSVDEIADTIDDAATSVADSVADDEYNDEFEENDEVASAHSNVVDEESPAEAISENSMEEELAELSEASEPEAVFDDDEDGI